MTLARKISAPILAFAAALLAPPFSRAAQQAAPEKALTWPECRERYLEIANEGQPSAEEAENGWPLIASLAEEAREAERQGLPLDKAWFERAAELVEYRRFVRDVSTTASNPGSDVMGASIDARPVANALNAELRTALERDLPGLASTLYEQSARLARAAALQPSIVALLTAASTHPAGEALANTLSQRPISGEMARALLRAMNGEEPMPLVSRSFRGDGWLGAKVHFVALPSRRLTASELAFSSKVIRAIVGINEFAARGADMTRAEREAAGLGEDALREEARKRLSLMDLDEEWSRTVIRVLRDADMSKSIRAGVHTLLAVECYRRDRGRLPETLDALVPDYLATLPVDPFAPEGRFVYRLVDPAEDPHRRAYLLYSVGFDLEDNGGVAADRIRAAYSDEQGEGTDAVFNEPGPK